MFLKEVLVKSAKLLGAGMATVGISGAGVGIGIVLFMSADITCVHGAGIVVEPASVLFSINENNTEGSFPLSLVFLGLGAFLFFYSKKDKSSLEDLLEAKKVGSTLESSLLLEEKNVDPLLTLELLTLDDLEEIYETLPFYFSENKSLGIILGIILGFVSLYLWPKRHMYARIHVFEYWQNQFGWFDIVMVRIVKYFLPGLQAFIVAILNLVLESLLVIHAALAVNYWTTKKAIKSMINNKKEMISNSDAFDDTVSYSIFEIVNKNTNFYLFLFFIIIILILIVFFRYNNYFLKIISFLLY